MDCKLALKLQLLGVQEEEVIVRFRETLGDWVNPVRLKFQAICPKNVNRASFCRWTYIYKGSSHLMGWFTVAQAQEEATFAWSKPGRPIECSGLGG